MGQRHRSQDFKAFADDCCRKHMSNPTPHGKLGAGPFVVAFLPLRDCCHTDLTDPQPRPPFPGLH